ncbi:hypothetical protein C5B90_06530 [Haloferax sp. Atlit-12N]|uniref:hypothetical protein n=1 Tax=Haloferax sp. Atlit-12N TaxID=2077203 RepID=UPI000E281C3B|nr:hypothetical protein [Haloferax sp. Atlit-12N]RDZ65997.1 hypothetical protein C5B90_06530 [Haloferax sp. Atlit-12N]
MSRSDDSVLFTYIAPFLGVLLVAVGIAAAVPATYDVIQDDITTCGTPTIAVDSPEETTARFGEDPRPNLTRFAYEDLSEAEQEAFRDALDDAVGESRVDGEFPHYGAFLNGSLVTYEGERHYTTVVAENPCFVAAPLQLPLGVFAIALGGIGILTPPAYRKLVALEEGAE